MNPIFALIRKRWLAYLERMARANQKNYGSQRLDCCDLQKGEKLHKRRSD